MKLTVLMENTTFGEPPCLAEPGFSIYIEDDHDHILFDTGWTEAFLHNAKIFGVDLSQLGSIVFSHGDDDHTGGFPHLAKIFDLSKTPIYAHTNCFQPKSKNGRNCGSAYNTDEMYARFNVKLSKTPIQVTKNLLFLGEIPSYFEFEKRVTTNQMLVNEQLIDDYILDDSALVYLGDKGLFIITGCSHSGICNIIEYAKEITGENRIHGIVGGFHLSKIDERLEKTMDYLVQISPEIFAPCHCVTFEVKAAMHKRLPITNMLVGKTLEI